MNIYFPPTSGLFGSQGTDWITQRLPRNTVEASAMASLAKQTLYDSGTMAPVDKNNLMPTTTLPHNISPNQNQPLTIRITEGRIAQTWFQRNRWWVIPGSIAAIALIILRK